MTRFRNTVAIILLLLGSVVGLETIARWIMWSPTQYTDTGTPRQGFSAQSLGDWVPDQEAVWIDKLELPFYVRINSAGFRNIEEIDPAATKVLVLGDSQTFGLFVSSHDVWTRIAQRLMNVGRDQSVQLLNTGLPGSTIIDHRDYVREKGARLRPDVVLFAIYQNDIDGLKLSDTTIGSTREDKRRSAADAEQGNYALRRFLNEHVAAYSLARELKDFFLRRQAVEEVAAVTPEPQRTEATAIAAPTSARPEPQSAATAAPAPAPQSTRLAAYAEQYKTLFQQSLDEAEKLQARPVMIYIPGSGECSTPSEMAEIADALAQTRKVPFLNLSAALCEKEPSAVYLYDPVGDGGTYAADSHLSRYGHITVGRAVAAFLARHL